MADDLFNDVEGTEKATVDVKAELVSGPPLDAAMLADAAKRTPVKNAALDKDKRLMAPGGTFTIHNVSNGFIAKTGNRAYGIRTDDFDRLQNLMVLGKAPDYSGKQPPWEGYMPNNPQLPAPDILHACRGLVIIHQLENCCLVAGTNGLYLAETPKDAMKDLDKIFKRL